MKLSAYRFVYGVVLFVLLSGGTRPYAYAQTVALDWQTTVDEYDGLIGAKQYSASVNAAKKALDIAQKKYGQEHLNVAISFVLLSDAYVFMNQYGLALPPAQRALSILEKTQEPDHPETVRGLIRLATIYGNLKQYDKELPLVQRYLAILEKEQGVNHPDTAIAMGRLGQTYWHLAQYDRALMLQQKTVVVWGKIRGDDHPDTAFSLLALAQTYNSLAQHNQALELQRNALGMLERRLGSESKYTAIGLRNLAHTYFELGQYEQALALQQRTLIVLENVSERNSSDYVLGLLDLAGTFIEIGQYEKALPLQQGAVAIVEKVDGNDTLYPNALVGLAKTYSKLGQFEKALPLQLLALAITEKNEGPESLNMALGWIGAASTLGDLSQAGLSLESAQKGLNILVKIRESEHPDVAWALTILAITYSVHTEYERALPLQQRALGIWEKVLGTDHPYTAWGLNNLAQTYFRLNQFEQALLLQTRALSVREKILGANHPDTAFAMGHLGMMYSDLGNSELAIPLLKMTINAYQSKREQVLRIGRVQLSSYTETVAYLYQNLATILTDQGRLAEALLVLDMLKEDEQFDFIRRSVNGDPRKTRVGYTPSEQKWMVRYREIADKLAALGAEDQALNKAAKLGLTPEQKQRLQALAADLAVARKAFDFFLAELREGFARQGPARAVEVVETSQQALRETQALLKGLGNDVVLLQYYLTDDKVGMLLTTPGVQLARTSNVSAKELNRLIAEFRRLLRDPKANAQPTAQALYQLLMAPVAQDLEQAGAKTVMLSLDGALRYLPFAALHDGKQYLVQRWNLPMYTSVTKGKLRDAVTPQWQAAGLGLTRAIGGFKALPAVKWEMSSIVKVGNLGVLPGEVYLDEAFNAIRLKDVAQRKFQLLHIASHFQFSPGTEVNSFLLLGDGQQLTLGDIRTQNYRFDNVDLLTLSACDTGLGGGRDANGREIEGFGVIAQQQGAKAVLATLWPVADQSTAELMAEMYRRRQDENLTKIEALRQAQVSLMRKSKYSHPFYWAPFILMGNWK